MEGYLVTKDAAFTSNRINGPCREYVHEGTVYIPKLDLKIECLWHNDTVKLSQMDFYDRENMRYLESLSEPRIKKVEIDDSKIQSLENLLKEKEELPKRIEAAARSIITQEKSR